MRHYEDHLRDEYGSASDSMLYEVSNTDRDVKTSIPLD